MMELLAAFSHISSRPGLRQSSYRNLNQGTWCRHLSAKLALTLAVWYLLLLTYLVFCSMPQSHHSPELVFQGALRSWAC